MGFSSKAARPLILVTGPDKRLRFGWWTTRFVLWLVGLQGCYRTASSTSLPLGVRGVIIGGGDDIEPIHYGFIGDAGSVYDRARDEFEIGVVNRALQCHLPLLGICRGAQLLNIVLGGTLHQDLRPLRKQTPNRNSIFRIKNAHVKSGSRLSGILKTDMLRVNSLHHQAVDSAGKGLIISAQDDDGCTQAIENTDHQFLIGVQWHPEYLPCSRQHRQLFHCFATAVRNSDAELSFE